ncbi:hypothetical protein [Microbacterium oleivorans]|uniref:Head-to-tail stopper n=1 Tax=Microbacterium oleivorans TaxID=273677 RepID=A0A4R5YG52_9MICO|nr:hypothetical protein [Microbacterium oleivorans]TDL43836.1 hypothetical protein E2R54_11645 [Microbacterium oleivorans]
MRLPDYFTPHTVEIRPLKSGGGMGGGYGQPRTVRAWVVDEQQTVATAVDSETLSSGTVSIEIDEVVPLGSLVTVWKGRPRQREAAVISVETFDHERLPSYQTLYLK